jgi:hypothetical protein
LARVFLLFIVALCAAGGAALTIRGLVELALAAGYLSAD